MIPPTIVPQDGKFTSLHINGIKYEIVNCPVIKAGDVISIEYHAWTPQIKIGRVILTKEQRKKMRRKK